jgi:hypothetical protein
MVEGEVMVMAPTHWAGLATSIIVASLGTRLGIVAVSSPGRSRKNRPLWH